MFVSDGVSVRANDELRIGKTRPIRSAPVSTRPLAYVGILSNALHLLVTAIDVLINALLAYQNAISLTLRCVKQVTTNDVR